MLLVHGIGKLSIFFVMFFFPEALIFVENNNVYDFIILNHKIFVFSFKDSALENINSFVCNNINNDS